MCMGQMYTQKYEKRIISKMSAGRGYIRVWKVVDTHYKASAYWPQFQQTHACFCSGIDVATVDFLNDWGFHAFRDLESAKRWQEDMTGGTIIECLALPEWVRNCGADRLSSYTLKTILFTHLCFPDYPAKKVTVKDFRNAVKVWKSQV